MFGSARLGRADVVFSDGFESGGFSAWSQVSVGGDGAAVVQGSVVRSGSFAARLSESANAGSKAFAREVLPSVQQELTASGDFQVVAQGASGGNVPLFRVLDPGSARILSVYRQNGTSNLVGVGYGGQYFSTSGRLALGTWATVAVHVVTAGSASTVEVSLNGSLVYQTTTASLTATGVGAVQIGNDTAAQAFDLVVDNVSLQNATSPTPTPPTNTALPVITGTAQQGQTLSASTGSWNGTQPIGYGYQWKRCNSAGANCVPLTGATTNSYTATSTDVGATLTVTVTATNSAGSATATATPTPTIQPAPTQGVVSLWHMDETSGTTMVDSVGTNHGTLHSVTTGLPGFLGSAYGFNGVAGYVSVPSSGSLNPGSSNFSFTVHIKTTSVPATPDRKSVV